MIEDVDDLLPWQLRGKAAPARRVLKTFMFTDVVGSTNLVEALGDEAWDTLLRWHDTTLREVFTAHEGREISTTGDGFFVSFDSPEAAVAAAIAIQRRLAEHRQKQGFAPQVRIGLHAVGRAAGRRQLPGQGRPRGVAHRRPRERRRDHRQPLDGRRGVPLRRRPQRAAQGPLRADGGRHRSTGAELHRAGEPRPAIGQWGAGAARTRAITSLNVAVARPMTVSAPP